MKEIFEPQVFSSHKTDWILSELPLFALSCFLYRRVSSLMNALEGKECLFLCEISINIYKLFIVIFVFFYVVLEVLLLYVYLFIPFFYTDVAVDCFFLYIVFYTDVVAIFLFIRWSYIYFVYYFNNTISIFATINK